MIYLYKEIPYVFEENLSTCYLKSLEKVIAEEYIYSLVSEISVPMIDDIDRKVDVIKSETIQKTYNLIGVNIDDNIHSRYKDFYFYKDKYKKDWYGRDKIADRIRTLFEGSYYKALNRRIKDGKRQLDYVKNHLKGGKIKGKIHNTFICSVFTSDRDLCYPDAHCLVSIDFKPERGKLHLIANWRAQYFNTKAYGNLISLAMLLRNICKESRTDKNKKSGFMPGRIISIAHKAILENNVNNEDLLNTLKF